jgi:glucans biosynthesis protein C
MKRLYDVDWLRTIIVLSIIPFHASIIFIQDPNAIMFVKDTMQLNGLVFMCSIVDRFHMVTLFLLAGMAIYYSLLKRSKERFLKERFVKLFIPLLTGSFLLNPITTYIWFINQGKTESFLSHYKGFFTRLSILVGTNTMKTIKEVKEAK